MKFRLSLLPLFFIAICCGVFNTQAQSLIPRAGVSLATASDKIHNFKTYAAETKFITGYYAGIAFSLPLGKGSSSLEAEILWINKGVISEMGPHQIYSEVFQTNATIYRRDTYKLNYLELPILFRKDFGKPGRNFFVLAGISVSYGLTGQYEYYYSFDSPNDPWEQSIDSKIRYTDPPKKHSDDLHMDNRIDGGLQVGFGVTVFRNLCVEARYGHGLIGFQDAYEKNPVKNRTIQLGVALPLKLKQ